MSCPLSTSFATPAISSHTDSSSERRGVQITSSPACSFSGISLSCSSKLALRLACMSFSFASSISSYLGSPIIFVSMLERISRIVFLIMSFGKQFIKIYYLKKLIADEKMSVRRPVRGLYNKIIKFNNICKIKIGIILI